MPLTPYKVVLCRMHENRGHEAALPHRPSYDDVAPRLPVHDDATGNFVNAGLYLLLQLYTYLTTTEQRQQEGMVYFIRRSS